MSAAESNGSPVFLPNEDVSGPRSHQRLRGPAGSSDSRLARPRRYWEPSTRLLATLKDYRRAVERGGLLGKLKAKLAVLRHRFWSVVTGADIPLNTWGLGEGLELPHPNGVVIHPDAQIGENCRIFQQVTLGTGPIGGVPRIGANVHIGAGAKIIGGVTIGDGAVIGANAVVVSDVPAGMTAAGIPAELKPDARGMWDRHKRSGSFVA